MSAVNLTQMSEAEYLAWQLDQDELYELVEGVPVARWNGMAGATLRHDGIVINAIPSLGQQLRGKKCRPMSSNVAVRIPKGNYRRPDVIVACGKAKSDKELAAPEPRLAIEVLSPSTANLDRTRKLAEYKTVTTIDVVLLIETELAEVAVHRRVDGQWQLETAHGLDKVIALPEIAAKLSLADLYESIAFEGTDGP